MEREHRPYGQAAVMGGIIRIGLLGELMRVLIRHTSNCFVGRGSNAHYRGMRVVHKVGKCVGVLVKQKLPLSRKPRADL